MSRMSSAPFTSIFEQHFDVVVVGSGFIGFAAARSLVAQGARVALLEPSGDLLWESVRALENRCEGNPQHSAWSEWLQSLRPLNCIQDGFLDPTHAEIVAARQILQHGDRWSTLLNVSPAAVTLEQGRIVAITVAAKGGLRQVRGSHWIDATENGLLATLCKVDISARQPSACTYNLVLQSNQWDPEESRYIPEYLQANPGCLWLMSVRNGERRLNMPVREEWWNQFPKQIYPLRQNMPDSRFLVSHIGLRAYPFYTKRNATLDHPISNLQILSPSLSNNSLVTLSDRFELGSRVQAPQEKQNHSASSPAMTAPHIEQTIDCDVLVAGSGTAGAVAAIAAARSGAKVYALEMAMFAGGIGTGGGIVSYHGGHSGGIQENLDRSTTDMTILLSGHPSYWEKAGTKIWHHDSKKLAIHQNFDQVGVSFEGDTLLFAVERDESGTVHSVLAVRAGKVTRYRARTFIDSTGDGDLCALAGADFVEGRPGDNRTLSYSQVAFALVQHEGWFHLAMMNFDSGWVDATDPEDLTRARLEGLLHQLHEDWEYPSRPFLVSPLLGIRQSRNIITDLSLTMNHLVSGARFADTLGNASAYADSHSVDYEFESDAMFFYFLVCRCFNHPLHTDLPYRMLLPKGLNNVWVACRAAGVDIDATYCVRMQRDMQRLGEAAGVAAAFCARNEEASRNVDMTELQQALRITGALDNPENIRIELEGAQKKYLQTVGLLHEDGYYHPHQHKDNPESLLNKLDSATSGIHLWKLAHDASLIESVATRLSAANPIVSFYAAAILAFYGDARAEQRLLHAITTKEIGTPVEESGNAGPFSQLIDIPFWLQAIALLRMCGTQASIPVLNTISQLPVPFNVATIIALTCERLATKVSDPIPLLNIQQQLLAHQNEQSALLPTTRSLMKILAGEKVDERNRTWSVDTTQDHSWQLHLILARTETQLGYPLNKTAQRYLKDPRAYVRKAFAAL
jgi:hypothetical protein